LCADLIATEFSHLDPVSQQIAAGREFLLRLDKQLAAEEDFIIKRRSQDARCEVISIEPRRQDSALRLRLSTWILQLLLRPVSKREFWAVVMMYLKPISDGDSLGAALISGTSIENSPING